MQIIHISKYPIINTIKRAKNFIIGNILYAFWYFGNNLPIWKVSNIAIIVTKYKSTQVMKVLTGSFSAGAPIAIQSI